MSNDQEETKQQHLVQNSKKVVGITEMLSGGDGARENFPDSDKEEENEGSEGIDEGFLQVASAGSCNTGSYADETRNSAAISSN